MKDPKKLLPLLLVFLLVFACGAGKGAAGTDVSLADIQEEMISFLCADDAVRLTGDKIYILYGIDPEDCLEEAAFYVAGATFSEEIILVKAVDSDAAGRVREMLQSHLDSILDQTRNYDPAGYAIAKKCSVETLDDYVWLLISAKKDDLKKILTSHQKYYAAGEVPVYTPAPTAVPVNTTPPPEDNASVPTPDPLAASTPAPWGLVEESDPVDDSWFDDALMIGNSVAHNLDTYVNYRRYSDWPTCMGTAQFFAGDLYSFKNAAEHFGTQPKYKGMYSSVEEVIEDTGAHKVYVVLSHVELIFKEETFEEVIQYAEALIDRIHEKAPDVTIYICSMTPRNKVFEVQPINSQTIPVFNEMLLKLAERKQCYYLDCYGALADENGFLPDEFTAEYTTGGIHLTYPGCEAWLDYLYRHTGS